MCYDTGYYICNLGLYFYKYARAGGSSCFLISFSYKHNFFTTELPSKKLLFISNT